MSNEILVQFSLRNALKVIKNIFGKEKLSGLI
jgi:hypothetical protein